MSDIALLYPHTYQHSRHTMPFHPLGIAHLSAVLRQAGMDVIVRDLTFEEIDGCIPDLVIRQPRIIGIYIMLTMVGNALMLARKIRQDIPDAVLVCGGPLPTVRPESFDRDFDIVFRGEAARSFPLFCSDCLASASLREVLRRHHRYPGLHAVDPGSGMLLRTPAQAIDEEGMDSLPIPDRSDFPHSRYQKAWEDREGFSPACIMTTYGCPHTCEFCSKPIFGRYFRRRSMDRIMEEIRSIRSFGYDGLWIGDDCFTLDPGHVRAFCRRMIRENPGMRWTCLSRSDGITPEDAALMREAGCKKVFFGLESGSNDVLKLMNKNTTVESAERTLDLFSRCGIETAGFFMVGYPGESRETIETTLRWSLTLPLDEISFTIPFPLPDTELAKRISGLQADADWRYESENRLVYESDFDQEYLHKRIEETYALFTAGKKPGITSRSSP
ncbi:MAG TPA: radical SAM protein [Deltaproteobacteria bacterium]|jgi:anaerobic magnesium-protoporphyrin IX monomethyl ester cyclase|nr:radical SAM protein [Deltaproteobacteria bacterium]